MVRDAGLGFEGPAWLVVALISSLRRVVGVNGAVKLTISNAM
jgi:hypothetical protein